MNYYEILQISPTANDYVVKAAFRVLTQNLHPDKNKNSIESNSQMQKINEAYRVLSNSSLRKIYDIKFNSEIEEHVLKSVRDRGREMGREIIKGMMNELKKSNKL